VGRHRRALSSAALVAVPLAFLAVFFAYPVGTILARGLSPDAGLDLQPLAEVFTDPELREVALFTLAQASLSTVLTLLVALPGAYVLARYEFPGRSLVRALVVVPFVLPTIVVATAFRAAGFDRGLQAILIAHVFFNYAVVVRIVGSMWSHLDPRQEEAARMLGAGRIRTFLAVTLPALRPAIVAAASIVFLFAFTSFGIILVLGGPSYSTIETEIYRQTVDFLNLPLAAALTIVQLVAVTALVLISGGAQGRQAIALHLRPAAEVMKRASTWGSRALLGGNLVLMAVLLGGPIAVLVNESFRGSGEGWSLNSYRALSELRRGSSLFVPPVEAIRNSLVFGVLATLLALVVGGMASVALSHRRTRGLDTLLMLPLGVSAVTVGFGFLVALDEPPLDLRSSPMLIPIAHALVAIPFVVRVMLPTLRSIDPRLREAATTLGASPGRVWREVDLPIVARALLVAGGFAFAISLGEFGATIFIARPDYPTLPVVIFRLLGQPGALNFGAAMAASTILMALTAVAILVLDRFRIADVGEF
jgi:thiamine transport system permease protein